METIAEIRKKTSAYNHLSDEELAEKLRTKFEPNADKQSFYSKVGLNQKSQSEFSPMDILSKSISALTAPTRAINRAETDVGAGLAKFGENVGATLAQPFVGDTKRHDMLKAANVKNPNMIDRALESAGQGIPVAAAGSLGLPAAMAGAFGHGFTQVEPGQQGVIDKALGYQTNTGLGGRTRSGIEDSLIAALTMGAGHGLAKGAESAMSTKMGKKLMEYINKFTRPSDGRVGGNDYGIAMPDEPYYGTGKTDVATPYNIPGENNAANSQWGMVPHDFNAQPENQGLSFLNPGETPRQPAPQMEQAPEIPGQPQSQLRMPEAPEPIPAPEGAEVKSPGMHENIVQHLSQNETLGQSSESFAKRVKNAFDAVVKKGSEKYNEVFNHKNIKGKKFDELVGDEDQKLEFENNPHGRKINEEFLKNPTLKNLHDVQSEIGSELGHYERQAKFRALSAEEKAEVKALRDQKEKYRTRLEDVINREAPEMKGKLKEASDYWRAEVAEPWYQDRDLYSMAKGRETNPGSNVISGIFKNPNEPMMKVANALGAEGHNAIAYHAMGKARENISPKDIAKLKASLEESGHEKYLHPETQGRINNYNKQLGIESENATAIKAHGKSETQRQNDYIRQMKAYNAQTSAQDRAYNQAVRNIQNEIKATEKRNAAKLKKQEEMQADFAQKEAMKKALLDQLNETVANKNSAIKNDFKKARKDIAEQMAEEEQLNKASGKINKESEMYTSAIKKYEEKVARQKIKEDEKKAKLAEDVMGVGTYLLSKGTPIVKYMKTRAVKGITRALRK